MPPKRRDMPDKAVAAKADEAKTLVEVRKKRATLTMFCANESAGIPKAQPALKARKIVAVKAKDGRTLGEEMMTTATEARAAEVTRVWPHPGDTTPVQEVSFLHQHRQPSLRCWMLQVSRGSPP